MIFDFQEPLDSHGHGSWFVCKETDYISKCPQKPVMVALKCYTICDI